jgi:hypothetical protein
VKNQVSWDCTLKICTGVYSVRHRAIQQFDWTSAFLDVLASGFSKDSALDYRISSSLGDYDGPTLHIAVFVEPYLQYILEGRKTIESRFAVKRCPPYGQVCEGDIVFLKRSGGPIYGVCQISQVWFYRLNKDSWKGIKEQFSRALCAQDPDFWKDREAAAFATLMRIKNVRRLEPIQILKRDRRGWVVIRRPSPLQLELPT